MIGPEFVTLLVLKDNVDDELKNDSKSLILVSLRLLKEDVSDWLLNSDRDIGSTR